VIHLDTNLLIAASDKRDLHVTSFQWVLALRRSMGASACAWTEFHSRLVDAKTERMIMQILQGGIIPFDEATAAFAGRLFCATGSKRRNRMDCMIAATAILAGAELATVNPDDFKPFVPHGLKLLNPP
jgi:predicted nucleic acid-binding protein